MSKPKRKIDEILQLSPVMPIMVIEDASTAGDLARALMAGGVRVAEITLRTPAALDAISAMKQAEPDMCVGAGTIITPKDAGRAADAGAEFLVTPGITSSLMQALTMLGMPYLPGAATGSEVATLMTFGVKRMKFFPAEPSGGAAWAAAMAGPFPEVQFCPTGGIKPQTAPDYLKLPNVPCVGGSWVAPAAMVAEKNWAGVEALAREAAALGS